LIRQEEFSCRVFDARILKAGRRPERQPHAALNREVFAGRVLPLTKPFKINEFMVAVDPARVQASETAIPSGGLACLPLELWRATDQVLLRAMRMIS
jgi:hypothetical protein